MARNHEKKSRTRDRIRKTKFSDGRCRGWFRRGGGDSLSLMQSSLCPRRGNCIESRVCIAVRALFLSSVLSFFFLSTSLFLYIDIGQSKQGMHKPIPSYQLSQIARVKPSHCSNRSFRPFSLLVSSALALYHFSCLFLCSPKLSPATHSFDARKSGSFHRGHTSKLPFLTPRGLYTLSVSLLYLRVDRAASFRGMSFLPTSDCFCSRPAAP